MRDRSKQDKNYAPESERILKAVNDYKERLYLRIISNEKFQVKIRDSFVNVGWLKFGQMGALAPFVDYQFDEEILLPPLEKFDTKTICKIAAICLCDTFWKMKTKYHFLWRWYYYFCHYRHTDLSDLITIAYRKQALLPKELIPDGDEINLGRLQQKWLFEPKNFLFGLIRVEDYEYDWVQTIAQLSLLSLEKPCSSFKK